MFFQRSLLIYLSVCKIDKKMSLTKILEIMNHATDQQVCHDEYTVYISQDPNQNSNLPSSSMNHSHLSSSQIIQGIAHLLLKMSYCTFYFSLQ